ncbi:MAG: DEAD/DEAH box helicase [Phycisphaerae bacterium]
MPFSSFGLHADILRGVKDLAFIHPTPIQTQAIPPAMAGRDVLACAATGSGKTAAFMLPTIHHLMTRSARTAHRAARALVLTPTRELASQILENVNTLAVHTPLSAATIIGGVSMGPQTHAFRTGTEILIATPGRLLDHLRQSYAKFDGLEILILDEADRMLDMGFLPDIRRILKTLPGKRQTLFFSATMPMEIRQLTREMLKDPVSIQIDRQTTPPAAITQAIYPVAQHLKSALLLKLLENQALESVICFTRTKHRANRLAATLDKQHIASAPIHGNRSMAQRTAALSGFKAGKFRVLVATDIAARGIDIADVSHVINFDCPHIPEDYVHRIGRTGRASATGDAFTFVAPDEESNLRAIERTVGKRLPRITLPDFDYAQPSAEALEVPIAQRIAAIRQRKAAQRARREISMAPRPAANAARSFGRAAHHDHTSQAPQQQRPNGGEQRGGRPTPQQYSNPPRAFSPGSALPTRQSNRSGQSGRRFQTGKPQSSRFGAGRPGGGNVWPQRGVGYSSGGQKPSPRGRRDA